MTPEIATRFKPTVYYCWQYEPSVPHPMNKNVRYRGWFLVAAINNPKTSAGQRQALEWAMKQRAHRSVTNSVSAPNLKITRRVLNKYFPRANKNPLPSSGQ